jgi:hypothetical protein
MNQIEEKRNKLNLNIRELLSIVDMIDGKKEEYADYKENTMSEEEYLNQQIELINIAKNRMINIFRD